MWSRGLVPVRGSHVILGRCFSVASNSTSSGIDDFLNAVSSTPPQAPVKSREVMETATEFINWLKQNPIDSIDQFIAAAHVSTTVKSLDQKKVFSEINEVAKSVLPKYYDSMATEHITSAMRFLFQTNPGSTASKDIQQLFLKKEYSVSDLDSVPFETLVKIIRYADESVDQVILETISKALLSRIKRELDNPTDLLVILAGEGCDKSTWFHDQSFIDKAQTLVPLMGTGEKCALLEHMAIHKQRNTQLLGAVINSISSSTQCLTVSQIVTITNACSQLTYYLPKIAKKVATDLEKNANVLEKWDSVLSIADAFVRMRMGDHKTWNFLARWAIENEKLATVSQLSRLVSGMARIGDPSGKVLAKTLKPRLAKERASTPNTWLNTVFALAYFQELDETHADSVLNKSFVKQVMESSHEKHDRLRKVMLLLLINSAAKVELGGNYKGPKVEKADFASYGIKFDAETIRNARQLKYSKETVNCDSVFLKTLFMLAPKDTHCGLPSVEECGAFVDAFVMPDTKSELVQNINDWGTRKPRPLFFFDWKQTKKNVETSGESLLFGQDQLALRLMRAGGYDPVVVFQTEFDYCKTDIDRKNMLREKIHNKV